tara:strand:- start:156 stop:752 length:597 start_codon:yes stop_codon:yes gene_type:complete
MKIYHKSELSKKKINEISRFHIENIKGEFNLFGSEFFRRFYKSISDHKDSKFITIEKKGKIEGFLIYTISPIALSKIYLKNNFYFFFYFLIRSLLNKELFIKFIKFLFLGYYLNHLKKRKNYPELIAIALSKKLRKKNYGKLLIKILKKKLILGKKNCCMVIFKDTKNLKKFYLSNSFFNTNLDVPFHKVKIYILKID